MSFEIAPLREEHIEDASRLFNDAYKVERSIVPILPQKYEEKAPVSAFLEKILAKGPGVAAINAGRLVGYMCGFLLPSFRGAAGVYSPEHAHAAEAQDRKRIYYDLYRAISAQWVDNGYHTHAITSLAHQSETIDTFFWLGFGMTAEDAIRDLNPIKNVPDSVTIRRAGPVDIDALVPLYLGMRTHMAAPPIFRINPGEWERDYIQGVLADSSQPVWLAEQKGVPVAFIGAIPNNTSACYIIRDEKTISLTAAFTEPTLRKSGTMTALLDTVFSYARETGFVRCSTDYEPENFAGVELWSRHFAPVCHSLIRTVDRRANKIFWQ